MTIDMDYLSEWMDPSTNPPTIHAGNIYGPPAPQYIIFDHTTFALTQAVAVARRWGFQPIIDPDYTTGVPEEPITLCECDRIRFYYGDVTVEYKVVSNTVKVQ